MTLWSDEIDHIAEPLPDGSDRVNVVMFHTQPTPLLLINTYMPTEGAANADYAEILDEVREIIAKFSSCIIIWTGDINADPARTKPSRNDKAFNEFCKKIILTIAQPVTPVPTFYHFNGSSASQIDHFIHRKCENPIISTKIDTRNPLNTGPHDPVTAEISTTIPGKHTSKMPKPRIPTRIKWDKVDKVKYKQLTEIKLAALVSQMENMPASLTAERVNTILHPPDGRDAQSTDGWPPSLQSLQK